MRLRHSMMAKLCPRFIRQLFRDPVIRLLTLILVLVSLAVTVPVVVIGAVEYAENRKYRVYKVPNNSFYEIVVPPPFARPESRDFKYKDLLTASSKNASCLSRRSARHEFVRILGKNLRAEDLQEPQMLIVGAGTALGAAIVRKFAQKDVPFIAIKGINEVDFSSPDARILFETITIKRAFIVYQPPLTRHSKSDGAQFLTRVSVDYIRGLTDFLNERDVPFVFAPVAHIAEEVMAVALKNGGCVVEVPHLVDHLAFHDLENPMIRAVRECRIAGATEVQFIPHEASTR
jgi:hypothetical protein